MFVNDVRRSINRWIRFGVMAMVGAGLSFSVQAQVTWPDDADWIWFANDPEEGGLHNDQRDVESLYYHVRDGYLFLRMKNRGPAGWCTTCGQSREHARYKWLFDTAGGDGVLQGGHVLNTEFMLFTEDFDNNLNGEVVFIDNDPLGDYNTRWSTTNPPNYVTNTPVGAPFANWQRVIGAVDTSIISPVPPTATTQYLGIPQYGVNNSVGYRIYGDTGPMDDPNMDGIPGPFPDGIYVDMYIDVDLLGAPDAIRLMWLTDQEDQNLDQAPCCDRPEDGEFIVIPLTASLRIEKDVPGGSPQDFAFTLTPPVGAATNFSLDDDADGTLPNTQVFSGLDPGTYTIAEGALPAQWTFGSLVCSNNNGFLATFTIDSANRSADINLEGGSDVSCRFVNVPPPPPGQFSLTVVKDAQPDGAAVFDFTLTGQAGFQLSDPANSSTSFALNVGSAYTLAEVFAAGWSTTLQCSDPAVTVNGLEATIPDTIAAGTAITCVYTNLQGASVTIAKVANESAAGTFDFTTDLPGMGAFSLSNGGTEVFTDVAPGIYVVTEAAEPGYVLQNIVCVDANGGSSFDTDLSTGTADLVVAPGAAITCTYTNGELGHLVIVKDAVPDDAAQVFAFEAGMGNFTLIDDGSAVGDCTTPSVNSRCFDDIAPGSYPTREIVPAGWALTDIACSGGQFVVDLPNATVTPVVEPGATMVCVFTNTRAPIPPPVYVPVPSLGRQALLVLAATLVAFGLVAVRRRRA